MTIHALREQGLYCSEIQRRTGFLRRSVAMWLEFETPPDRRRAALKRTSPWYLEDFLTQCWKDGIRTGSALFQLIRDRGYGGSLTHLQGLLAGWRRAEKQEQGDPPRSTRSLNRSRTRKRGTRYARSSRPRSASNQVENSPRNSVSVRPDCPAWDRVGRVVSALDSGHYGVLGGSAHEAALDG